MTEQSGPSDSGYPQENQPNPGDLAGSRGNRTPLYQANNAARYQRQTLIEAIQSRYGRRLICYVSGAGSIINENDTIPIMDLLHNVQSGDDIDLLLHTHGGSVDMAEKLVRLIRSRTGQGHFRIIVPELAKSSGTLMVLGADSVVMSDTSELGPIDPQMRFADSSGLIRWQAVQNYLDADEEYSEAVNQNRNDFAAQIMLGKLDPATVKLCQAVRDRARQCAEDLLKQGMFREGGNWSQTVSDLLDTKRWLSHSQMISWQEAQHRDTLGLVVDHLDWQSQEWQEYWQIYCHQRLAITDSQKLYESAYASLTIDDPVG